MKLFLLVFVLSVAATVGGQVNVDSLRNAWNNPALHDTLRLQAIYSLGNNHYSRTHPDSAILYARLQIEFAQKRGLKKWEAFGHNVIGLACRTSGEWARAIEAYQSGMAIFNEIGLKKNVAIVGLNLGTIYFDRGDYRRALECYDDALKTFDEIGMKNGVAACLGNIANIRIRQQDHTEALAAYEKCRELFLEMGDQYSLATTWVNMGNALEALDRNSEAIENMHRGRVMFQNLQDLNGTAGAMNNLGTVYRKLNILDSALHYFTAAREIYVGTGNMRSQGNATNNIALVFLEKGDLKKAISLSNEALAIASELGAIREISEAAKNLYTAYKKSGRPREALEMHERYIAMQDSLINEANAEAVMQQQFRYEFDKKEALLDAEKQRQILLSEETMRRKDFQRNAFVGGFVLMLLVAGVSFRNYRRKQLDNRVISAQKQAVENKNEEIMQSIAYARRLQEAVLPQARVVKEFFDDSILIYMPKDIVSGDFYWMENADSGVQYFAVGDCTGHGVSGAMLSVLGITGLNRCLTEFKEYRPDRILIQLSAIIQNSFESSEVAVSDGMDLALCALDTQRERLLYAGANIPLFMLRQDRVTQHKPDNHTVGLGTAAFTCLEIKIEPGDVFFLSTAGLASQLSVSGQTLTELIEKLFAADDCLHLDNFRSRLLEQIAASGDRTNDICLLAFRI